MSVQIFQFSQTAAKLILSPLFIALLTTTLVTIFIIPDNSKKLYEGLKRKLLIYDTCVSQKLKNYLCWRMGCTLLPWQYTYITTWRNLTILFYWKVKMQKGASGYNNFEWWGTLILVFKSLTIRLGYPYVYAHQGDHEHLFSFVGARLCTADDVQKADAYPFERSVGMVHSKMCMVCNIFIAKWITTDNERVPEDPFFFCNECYRHFNYNPKKEKLGNFKAYPYIDVNAL